MSDDCTHSIVCICVSVSTNPGNNHKTAHNRVTKYDCHRDHSAVSVGANDLLLPPFVLERGPPQSPKAQCGTAEHISTASFRNQDSATPFQGKLCRAKPQVSVVHLASSDMQGTPGNMFVPNACISVVPQKKYVNLISLPARTCSTVITWAEQNIPKNLYSSIQHMEFSATVEALTASCAGEVAGPTCLIELCPA